MNDDQPFRGARYAPLSREPEVRELHHVEDVLDATDPCQCGTCGRWWDDAVVTSITPTPSGRCPFEYEHDDDDDDVTGAVTWIIAANYSQHRTGDWHATGQLPTFLLRSDVGACPQTEEAAERVARAILSAGAAPGTDFYVSVGRLD